jgi:hypothetical protein
MPPKRKPRQTEPDLETNTAADALPNDLRRDDLPETPPEELPPPEERGELLPVGGGFTPTEDGGVDQHPVHDDDLEDNTPSDYERELDRLDAAARPDR